SEINKMLCQIPGVKNVIWQNRGEINTFVIEPQPGDDLREKIYQTAVEQRWMLRELKRTAATLEDLFVQVTTRE
ncbi:MAG: hypothetical protein AAB019_00600, partial [Planctomycetota bacterium]